MKASSVGKLSKFNYCLIIMKWELKEALLFPYMAILLWGYNKVHKTVCEINVTCRD